MSSKKSSATKVTSSHRGYTILEMGVVVGLLAVISAIVVPDLQNIRFSNDLSIAASSVMQGVNTAKILAQSGKAGSDWGFNVPHTSVFQGETYAVRNAAGDLSFDIPDTVTTSGLSEVTFSQLDGYISQTGVVILTALNGAKVGILIDDQGIPTPIEVTDDIEQQAEQSSSASSSSSIATSSAASSSSSLQVATSVTLTSSPSPSTYGSLVTLTATVSPSSLVGTVTFRDGASTIGTASLVGGTAVLTTSSLIVGNHSLTAVYGNNNYTSNTSNTRIHTVNKASCAVALTSSLNPATFGVNVRLTAAVTPSSATGTVTFKDGSTTIATATLSSGSAFYDITSLAVGVHSLTVIYSGNTNLLSCTSSALSQTISALASSSSSSVASSAPSSAAGSSVSSAPPSQSSSAASSTPASSSTASSAVSNSSYSSSSISSSSLSSQTSSSVSSSSFSSSSAGGVAWQSQNVGILLLDATSAGALTLSGNGHLSISNANGTVTVNSSNTQAVKISGNGIVNATTLNIKGNKSVTGNGHIYATINTNVIPSADPLAAVATPSPPSQSYSAVNLSGNNQLTINPGTYVGGIKVSGNGRLTMNPGIYYLQGGGFKLSGNAIVTANGVMIYSAPSLSTDIISLSGNANLTLSPMSTGIFAGISIYQRRTSNLGITIDGNGIINLDGVFYAAASTLTLAGNANVNLQCLPNPRFILNKLNFTGNGQFNVQ